MGSSLQINYEGEAMSGFDDDTTTVDEKPVKGAGGKNLPERIADVPDRRSDSSPGRRMIGPPSTREEALALAQSVDVDFIEIDFDEDAAPQTGVLRQIPKELAVRYGFMPIRQRDDGHIVIAVSDPRSAQALEAEQMIRFRTSRQVDMVVALEQDILTAIETHYGFLEAQQALQNFGGQVSVVSPDEVLADQETLEREGQRADIIEFVDGTLLPSAVQMRASDIHFEPGDKSCRVRFRIDGRLRLITTVPVRMRDAVVSRIKILAQLDITERRAPQDGRIRIRLTDGREVDFRVAVAPTLHGEKVVLRVLDQSAQLIRLDKLGFSATELHTFLEAIRNPWGMVLVTGPTGSGKTTTLAAALHELNGEFDNIQTIEDPVEIPIPGISQTNVNVQAGMTFANALRAFLRMDPDIIMVGEIRDYETAEIAVKAAATGHLVLSTLHTNDAASTISRLMLMGIEPYVLSDGLNLIVAQRLVRRVCEKCSREEVEISPEHLMELGFSIEEIRDFSPTRPTGKNGRGPCRNCGGTGYKGRAAIYELLRVSPELKRAILQGADAEEIRRTAIQQGMRPLRRAGMDLVLSGVTSIDEVLRVTRNG